MASSSAIYSDKVFEGTFLIIKCLRRHDDKGVHNGGWYRVFGSGGFWTVPLLDRRAGRITATSPYQAGQALVRVRLRPLNEPVAVAKCIAHLETFSLLVPRASGITLTEL